MLVAHSCSAEGQWESCSQTKHHATGSRLGTSRWKFTSYAISQTLAKGRGFRCFVFCCVHVHGGGCMHVSPCLSVSTYACGYVWWQST